MNEIKTIYLVTPFICALIGWFTNFIAVKMLFHPHKPINLVFFKLHGIFPKRQKELARNLAESIEKELISFEDVKKHFNDPEIAGNIQTVISAHIDKFLKERLIAINPMIAMFLNDEMLGKIKAILAEELSSIVPDIVNGIADGLEKKIDFRDMVKSKVEMFDMVQLEDLLFSIMKKEFKFIELAGAVLGFIIGIIQSALIIIF